MGRTAIVLGVFLGLGLAGSPAQAQKMYRCGKVYQDRPCPAGQAGKVVGRTGAGAAAPQAAGRDPECAQKARAERQTALDLAAALKAQREGKLPPVRPGY